MSILYINLNINTCFVFYKYWTIDFLCFDLYKMSIINLFNFKTYTDISLTYKEVYDSNYINCLNSYLDHNYKHIKVYKKVYK